MWGYARLFVFRSCFSVHVFCFCVQCLQARNPPNTFKHALNPAIYSPAYFPCVGTRVRWSWRVWLGPAWMYEHFPPLLGKLPRCSGFSGLIPGDSWSSGKFGLCNRFLRILFEPKYLASPWELPKLVCVWKKWFWPKTVITLFWNEVWSCLDRPGLNCLLLYLLFAVLKQYTKTS